MTAECVSWCKCRNGELYLNMYNRQIKSHDPSMVTDDKQEILICFPPQARVHVHACLCWVCSKCQGRCYRRGYCRWWSLISGDLLTPQEAAVENVGPVDDGTESLGDVPSLSEDVAGIDESISVAAGLGCDINEMLLHQFIGFIFWFWHCVNVVTGAGVEFKPSDSSIETVLSEEGHQVGTQKSPLHCYNQLVIYYYV